MATFTPSKTLRTLQASTSNAAGATTTSSIIDLTTKFGGILTVKATNGATGPTIGCTIYVEISGDNTNWKNFSTFTHVIVANAVGEWAVDVPSGVMYLRVRFTGNTGQAVTVEAYLQELTNIVSA